MHNVSLTACGEYESELLDAAIERHFALLKLDEVIKSGMKVMIKPNLIIRKTPEEAATTHPEVVKSVVRALKARGVAEIFMAESSGGPYNKNYMNSVYKGTGMEEVARQTGMKINDDYAYDTVFYDKAKRCKQFQIIQPALKADIIINIAKLKTHAMMRFSGASKNLFGLVPGLIKPEMHCRFPQMEEFAQMLVDLAEYIMPQVNIIDGIYGMEGDGPTGGRPRHIGVLIASRNCFAADLAAMRLIGMSLKDSPVLNEAVLRGNLKGFDDLTYFGDPAEPLYCRDYKRARTSSVDFINYLPGFMRGIVTKIASPRPVINRRKCIGCAKCAQSCPQDTIAVVDNKAHIDYSVCIKCYCCHEMCPVKAVDIKRFKLFNL